MHNRRKSSFAQLVSPLPHKTISINSPTIHRRCNRTHSGSDDELVSTIPSALPAPPCDTSKAAFEREPTMTFFESDEKNEEDDDADRQLYLEAVEDFRELMGYNAVYRSRQNSFEKTRPPVDMKHSYGLSSGNGDSSSGEDVDYDVDELTFPRLGQSPEPIMPSSNVDVEDDEAPVWEPPPFRASNPITKNEIFGWNGVVADVDALKTSKVLLPPHEYFVDDDYEAEEDEEGIWSSRHRLAAATFTPPRRRTRIKSEPNVRFWHQPDDGVQCF